MCLYIETGQKAKVAEEDVVCYKQLEQNVNSPILDKGVYRSYYQYKPIKLGNTYRSRIEMMGRHPGASSKNYIEKAIHSFARINEAIRDIQETPACSGFKAIVVKAIIPKGSTYYEGTFGGCLSYASNKLHYTKEIVWEGWMYDEEN